MKKRGPYTNYLDPPLNSLGVLIVFKTSKICLAHNILIFINQAWLICMAHPKSVPVIDRIPLTRNYLESLTALI